MANDSSASSKRAPNFTKSEEEILVQLVKKHDKVLECKRTDTNSNILKEETWKTISKKFNSTTGTFRDPPTLRRKYENLKKKAKKKFADLKCHVKGTDGGEPANIVFDSIDETIQSMLGTQLIGMTSQFDSDATLVIQNDKSTSEIFKLNTKDLEVQEGISENNIKIIIEDTTSFDNENTEDKENINEKKDWGKYCPSMLRTPKSKKLNVLSEKTGDAESPETLKSLSNKRFKKTSDDDTWTEVGKAKLNLIDIHKQCFLEEHKLKIEKLKMEKEILQYELEYKKNVLEKKN